MHEALPEPPDRSDNTARSNHCTGRIPVPAQPKTIRPATLEREIPKEIERETNRDRVGYASEISIKAQWPVDIVNIHVVEHGGRLSDGCLTCTASCTSWEAEIAESLDRPVILVRSEGVSPEEIVHPFLVRQIVDHRVSDRDSLEIDEMGA